MSRHINASQKAYLNIGPVLQNLTVFQSTKTKDRSVTIAQLLSASPSGLPDCLRIVDVYHDMSVLDDVTCSIAALAGDGATEARVLDGLLKAYSADISGEYDKALVLYESASHLLSSLPAHWLCASGLGLFINEKRKAVLVRTGQPIEDRPSGQQEDSNSLDARIQRSGFDFIHDCFRHDVAWDRLFPVFRGHAFLVPHDIGHVLVHILEQAHALRPQTRKLKTAAVLRKCGMLRESLELLQKIERDAADAHTSLIARINRAVGDHLLGNNDDAIAALLRTGPAADDAQEPYLAAVALNNLGIVLMETGDWDRARHNFTLSMDRLRPQNDKHAMALIKTNILYLTYVAGQAQDNMPFESLVRYCVDKPIPEEIGALWVMAHRNMITLSNQHRGDLDDAFYAMRLNVYPIYRAYRDTQQMPERIVKTDP